MTADRDMIVVEFEWLRLAGGRQRQQTRLLAEGRWTISHSRLRGRRSKHRAKGFASNRPWCCCCFAVPGSLRPYY
jgi:hypothetical protein